MELNEREIELIDGMIEVQLDHAKRCDTIANRVMAEKQKGWDLERVALLEKIKNTRTDPLLEDMAMALKEIVNDAKSYEVRSGRRVTWLERGAVVLQKYLERGE
jgi:hypothetical protein